MVQVSQHWLLFTHECCGFYIGSHDNQDGFLSTVGGLFHRLLYPWCLEGWPGRCLLAERLMEVAFRHRARGA